MNGHIRQHRYALINAELSFTPATIPNLRVSVYGRNLTDHDYLQSTLPTFAADLTSWSPPRTYGIRADFTF